MNVMTIRRLNMLQQEKAEDTVEKKEKDEKIKGNLRIKKRNRRKKRR